MGMPSSFVAIEDSEGVEKVQEKPDRAKYQLQYPRLQFRQDESLYYGILPK